MNLPPRMPKLNKEQKAHQQAIDWWHIFGGFIIGAILAFILGFELAK